MNKASTKFSFKVTGPGAGCFNHGWIRATLTPNMTYNLKRNFKLVQALNSNDVPASVKKRLLGLKTGNSIVIGRYRNFKVVIVHAASKAQKNHKLTLEQKKLLGLRDSLAKELAIVEKRLAQIERSIKKL